MKTFILIALFSISSFAATINHKVESYKLALASEQYLKFIGSSTKLGFITTSFDGYAKEYQTEYNIAKTGNMSIVKGLQINISANSLDTDNSSRDEKLHQHCLNVATFKNIKASTQEDISLVEIKDKEINLLLTIKDITVVIPAIYSIKIENNSYIISFTTAISIKNSKIPDPSIAIAKVHDTIKIEGKIILK